MVKRCAGVRRRGAILPLGAVCLIILLGFVALAVDLGIMAVARSQAQNAADAAATAGVRAFNGDSSNSYNYTAVPNAAIEAATNNRILNKPVTGSLLTPADVSLSVSSYTSGQVTVDLGSYAYYYSDDNPAPAQEGFKLDIPRQRAADPWSAVRATVTANNPTFFGSLFGISNFNTRAVAVAVHRPRDVVVILDLSGSMLFQSLVGAPMTTTDVFGTTGTFAFPNSVSTPRTKSMNPESVFPQFGHYSDISTAALQGGATSYQARSGESVDPSNISSTQNAGPPICADFYSYPVGGTAGAGNVAFSRAPDSQATTPGGDDYLKTTLDTGSTYAQTVAQFNNNSTTTNPKFEVNGYQSVRGAFNMYTQGPGYWGKTFWIWPPAPRGANVLNPPSSITSTAFNWYNNQSNDWRQRFFVAVNTGTNVPSWVNHNTILFDTTGSGATMNNPGVNTTVTENGVSVTYTFRINYAAILYWIKNVGTNPFPSTLVAGRIRYYGSIPDPTDNALNSRWWAFDPTNPSVLTSDERFWKEYIDFVLGFYGTGPNAYNRFQFGSPISGLIGNGDYFTWTGSTVQISQRPQPQPPPSTPGAPYQTGTVKTSSKYDAGSTTITLTGALASTPMANKDYVTFTVAGTDTVPYLITAATTTTLTIAPGLAASIAKNAVATANIYSPYMDYNDCPKRPRHQFWFGPMTLIDWLGNYNLITLVNNTAPHEWWPGNCHAAHSWACKVGVQSAMNDIKQNHPNDFVAMTYFSSPKYSNSGSGHHNCAVVPMGRNYQQLTDSLWFPPSTVTGTKTEINPYDADMLQVPRSDGSTCPGMGFMIAYNQLSSSATNLRTYTQPQPQYRGSAGGLGRKGAARLIIFETDGFPNLRAGAAISASGSDSYYPIRVKNQADLTNSANTEWPGAGTYADSDVFDVVQQICALDSASTPGFSTTRKKVLVHCIGYGSIFDPGSSGKAQTTALTFLQQIQVYGNTATDTDPSAFPSYKKIYGKPSDRIANMKKAFTTIMQDGIQVTLIQ